LQDDYRSGQPYPHLVLDNLFPAEILDKVLAESTSLSKSKWVHEDLARMIKSNLRSAVDLDEEAFRFTAFLHSAGFLYFLSECTGIQALLPDPYLTGAGFHMIGEGGRFDVHADRNTDHHSGMLRRIVMLIYLNKCWKPEYGGQLELWDTNGVRCEKSIEPIFNRTVIFQIGDNNFHAVRPVAPGRGITRRSFAAYFHTVGESVITHETIFAPPVFQGKMQPYKKILRETLPPVLYRALKAAKRSKKPR
jgi:Rps23 Pro-64 3,4-dihydroxylase Tpa1-like proline 4-hydroxylase